MNRAPAFCFPDKVIQRAQILQHALFCPGRSGAAPKPGHVRFPVFPNGKQVTQPAGGVSRSFADKDRFIAQSDGVAVLHMDVDWEILPGIRPVRLGRVLLPEKVVRRGQVGPGLELFHNPFSAACVVYVAVGQRQLADPGGVPAHVPYGVCDGVKGSFGGPDGVDHDQAFRAL